MKSRAAPCSIYFHHDLLLRLDISVKTCLRQSCLFFFCSFSIVNKPHSSQETVFPGKTFHIPRVISFLKQRTLPCFLPLLLFLAGSLAFETSIPRTFSAFKISRKRDFCAEMSLTSYVECYRKENCTEESLLCF